MAGRVLDQRHPGPDAGPGVPSFRPAHRLREGADALSTAVTGQLEDALVGSLGPEELRRALQVAATGLLLELSATDAVQAQRLEGPIRELADLAESQPQNSSR